MHAGELNFASPIKTSSCELLKRYKAMCHVGTVGHIGFVLLGKGVIESDGTLSKAVLVTVLVAEMEAVKTAAAKMEHQKFHQLAKDLSLRKSLSNKRPKKTHKVQS